MEYAGRSLAWVAVARGVLVLGLALGLLGASTASSQDASSAALPAEQAERHTRLLQRAEQALAQGALEDGLAAVGEAVLLADRGGDGLRLAAARLVRANLLLARGDAAAAATDLERVLASPAARGAPALLGTARSNLANVRAVAGEREAAGRLYEEVVREADARGDRLLAARARVNALRLAVDAGRAPDPEEAAGADAAVAGLPAGLDRALLRVHLGETHRRAVANGFGERASTLRAGDASLRAALAEADTLGGPGVAARVRAQALGTLAGLYALEGRLDEALSLTRRALLQATRSEVGAERFPWHLQLARIQARRGRRDEALDAYAEALRVLEAHRGAITRSQRLGAALRGEATDASRLYREYVDLLLRRARGAASPAARRADLLTAQSVLERLKSDELRDYFEDDCVIRYREKLASVGQASFAAVVVYPFVLDDRLELLVSHPGEQGAELTQLVVDVDRETLRAEVARLRQLLEKRTTRQYLRPAQRLHDWLIAPLEPILAEADPRTLVFVPDGILRTVPMAALHDGERFLIERHALGLTPGLELTDPQPFDARERRALVAGVSDGVQGFEPLPNVAREVDSVHDILGGERLLNRGFSRSALTDRIREEAFGLIHIASHAQFDATAAGGFMLAHDGRISFDALADAVSAAKYRDEPLELVILSACETAEGDERAALGLSGVAVKAGARSALGTLWQVSDAATAEFMIRFYRALEGPGTSRAEAVRDAQLRLLRDPAYQHPYYWSPFLLINSWL